MSTKTKCPRCSAALTSDADLIAGQSLSCPECRFSFKYDTARVQEDDSQPALPGILIIAGVIFLIAGVLLLIGGIMDERAGVEGIAGGVGLMVYGAVHIAAGSFCDYVVKSLIDIRRQLATRQS